MERLKQQFKIELRELGTKSKVLRLSCDDHKFAKTNKHANAQNNVPQEGSGAGGFP